VNEEDIAGNPVFKGFGWALSHEQSNGMRVLAPGLITAA